MAGSDTVRQSPIASLRLLKGHSAANCPITVADFPFSGFPTPNCAGGGNRLREKRKENPQVIETTAFPSSQAFSLKRVTRKMATRKGEKESRSGPQAGGNGLEGLWEQTKCSTGERWGVGGKHRGEEWCKVAVSVVHH